MRRNRSGPARRAAQGRARRARPAGPRLADFCASRAGPREPRPPGLRAGSERAPCGQRGYRSAGAGHSDSPQLDGVCDDSAAPRTPGPPSEAGAVAEMNSQASWSAGGGGCGPGGAGGRPCMQAEDTSSTSPAHIAGCTST